MKKKNATTTTDTTHIGVIVRSTGNLHQVRLENRLEDTAEIIECRIKGKLRMQDVRTTNPFAVGDIVHLQLDENKSEVPGVITTVEPRQNCIMRKSVNLSKQAHIIAANIDRAYLVVTLAKPQTSTVFIDRFLVTAEAHNIPVTIIFNKYDIYDSDSRAELAEMEQIYRDIGYECIAMSALNPSDIDTLRAQLNDQVSLFSGHSGVGKSTLINALEPDLSLKVGEISEQYGEGKHTTTFAEMFPLSDGGYIIDTPGIRGFGIVDLNKDVIANYFPEMFAIHQHCKFSNCLHLKEPQCAIIDAVDNGEIALSRYDSYLSIYYADDEDQYRRNTRK